MTLSDRRDSGGSGLSWSSSRSDERVSREMARDRLENVDQSLKFKQASAHQAVPSSGTFYEKFVPRYD